MAYLRSIASLGEPLTGIISVAQADQHRQNLIFTTGAVDRVRSSSTDLHQSVQLLSQSGIPALLRLGPPMPRMGRQLWAKTSRHPSVRSTQKWPICWPVMGPSNPVSPPLSPRADIIISILDERRRTVRMLRNDGRPPSKSARAVDVLRAKDRPTRNGSSRLVNASASRKSLGRLQR
jgi:hypothetical protein